MGKRGPAPTPTNILKIRGSWRANKNPLEPKPKEGRPTCPRWLSPEAKKVWKVVTRILLNMRVLTVADGMQLARYCDAFVRWRSAAQHLNEHGEVYPVRDEKGEVKAFIPWPQVSIYNKLFSLLSRTEAQYGMTPAARTSIEVALGGDRPEFEEDEEWEGLFSA